MRTILLDTNAYVAFKQGHSDMIAILQQADEIGINAIVLGELVAGFTAGTKHQKNLIELDDFLTTSRIKVISIDEMTPTFYARIYATLRRKGKPIPTNDMWIAASALQHGYKLCSFDKHFSFVENLIVATTIEEFLF